MRCRLRYARPLLLLAPVLAVVWLPWVYAAGDGDAPAGRGAVSAGPPASVLDTRARSRYVHNITLYDHEGRVIDPTAEHPPPYSPIRTCGKCHDTDAVSHGWHFNAAEPEARHGRAGEPWWVVDTTTGTSVPVSPRPWDGVFSPAELGLSQWDFVTRFATHLPGGYPEKKVSGTFLSGTFLPDGEAAAWELSGGLQIDCMLCHSADNRHDFNVYAKQVEKRNFKWAPTAALGLASVRGEAADLAEAEAGAGALPGAGEIDLSEFDPAALDPAGGGGGGDEASTLPLTYDPARFDAEGRVYFDIAKHMPSERCYQCHSTAHVGAAAEPRWLVQEDVHLKAGLSCVDCHRNDIRHDMIRGYPGEAELRGDPSLHLFTCAGCHDAGHLGAPQPQHKGLPPLHLDRMSCTACHSGPRPGMHTLATQTGLAHGLGLAIRDRDDDALPHVVEPVFIDVHRDDPDAGEALIVPHRVAWPSYWARADANGRVEPLPLEQVRASGLTAPEDEAAIKAGLKTLAGAGITSPLYYREGLIHQLDAGAMVSERSWMQGWPLGHDVRPAADSLGVTGCAECHAADAPMYVGRIDPEGRPRFTAVADLRQQEFFDDDPALTAAWNLGFAQRPAFKVFAFAAVGLTVFILLAHAMRGVVTIAAAGTVARPTVAAGPRRAGRWLRGLALVIFLAGFLAQGATGLWSLLFAREFGGWGLWVHFLAAPVFIAGLLGVVATQAGRHAAGSFGAVRRFTFWVMATAGVVSAAPILAAMGPYLPSADQHALYRVHRWATGVLSVSLAVWLVWAIPRGGSARTIEPEPADGPSAET